ncbi:teichoic acid ABC transporter ATP-binding protein [Hyphomicrobium nitrativorans NL23]|uniref:Teichoic acid ABC transporter ATP-binding protein n=1 Tax=Hyphomicrobium nitrativorans NL23 TaxID=1029756 RepID=V5S9R6_9HYPH|nr:ATP-binding cassette domain-containing protein [Hyphomicrobium nitrativorans]AHB47207.1 teichoic acid ABC transporter ATP-binding protein [Hyphomicrobium nitrativorans NL23]
MSNVAIRINSVAKEYQVFTRPLDLAIEVLTRRARHTTFRALDGVSFEVQRGEVLGIIGPNGAGKSTLLKIITGVLEATSGSVEVSGRVSAILELGLGFHPEYSGRENIYLSGLLYGMNKGEIDRKIDGIIAFSGLGDFINRPVKTYSSGMHARLAFSIATAVDPEILIIDEALATGDAGFVQKSLRRIRQLCSGGRTVLLVSHGTALLAQLCNRVVWLDQGRVRMVGPSMQVVQAYDLAAHQSSDEESWIETVDDALDKEKSNQPHLATAESSSSGVDGSIVEKVAAAPRQKALEPRKLFESNQSGEDRSVGQQIFRRGPVFIDSVELINSAGERTTRLKFYEHALLRIKYRVDGPLPESSLGVAISINNRLDLSSVAQFYTQNIRPFETRESYDSAPDRRKPARRGTIDLHFDYVPFRKGEYLLSIGLLPNEPATWEFYEYRHFYYPFFVEDAGMDLGAPVFLDLSLVHRPMENETPEANEGVSGSPSATMPSLDGGVTDRSAPEAAAPEYRLATLRSEIEAICFREGGYPKTWPRHEACPACDQVALAPAFSKYSFTHAQCSACGFVTVDPYPPDDIIAKLYDGAYYTQVRNLFEAPLLLGCGDATPFSAPKETLMAVIDRATRGRASGTWLDVGGGLGAFANLIAEARPSWTVKLNEFNKKSVDIARNAFNDRFTISTADLANLRASGELFDVISSVAVLEHIPKPKEFLQGYASVLKPDGMLVTVVPHFSELNAKVSRASSANVVPPYHVSLFNERGLRRLLGRVEGLEIVAIDQAGPSAFIPVHLVDYGDYYDITVPTEEDPQPRSIAVRSYSTEESNAINALSQAEKDSNDYFAERDGRQLLIAYCKKKGSS